MAQHDYNIANQSGADFRADLNNALLAIATVNSGATEPSTTFAHQLWVDTSSSVLKIRNAADNAWITTGVSITASNTFTGDLTGNVVGNVTGNLVGNVAGDLTGNADSADILTTARTISLSGDVVGSVSFDGSANVDIDTVVQINSITLGTDTTGDYVESMSGGTGVTVTGGTGEGSTPSVAIGQAVSTTDDVTFNTVTATDEFIGDIDGSVRFTAKADEALSKGDVIYVSGVSGNTPTVGKAKADDASKMPAFGLAAEDANANNNLQIVTLGNLTSVDTSNESVGEILYVSTTAGEYATTAPSGESAQIQNIGKVLRSHDVNGSIKVGGAGRSNATPNLDNGKIFIGNGSNQAVTSTLDTSIVVENTNLYYTTTRANTDFDSRLATKDTGDLTEGSNLYYTSGRANTDFDTRLATKDTGDLSEGSNLYYTDARVNSAFDTRLATKDTDDVSEGATNLYYTSGRANTDFDTRLGTKSTSDLAEGTNLYYTSARFDSAFTSKDTDDLSEGTTNLYYTTTRFDSAFGNKTTADLTENTNLYYTDTRANSAIDTRVTKAFVDALNIQAASVDANSVTLGTDTVGNYIQTITGTANKITVSGSGSESADVTLSLPDDVQIADSLTVAGNLTVNGTLTSLDTTNLDIEDNLFQLNAGLTGSPVNDSGMLINRGTSDNSIFMWDESVDKFTMGLTTADGSATGNITLNSLGTLVVNVEGDLTGAVTGTVSSLSNHDTDDLTEGTNLYYTQARFDSAFTAKSTTDLSEGSNLYYTDARFDTRLATKDTDDVSEGTSNLYYTSARFNSAFGGKSTSDLSEGSNLYYTDARVQAVSINNVVEDTTPQLGGDLASNGNDILFADNDKAIFGAGSDLQIYHDSNNSYITDTGTGNLYIRASNELALTSAAGEAFFLGIADGSSYLYHNGSVKLNTTSTGIDVTGTVTADSFQVDDTDDIRLRFLNASTFKGGLQIATTAGDMIGTSEVDDLCIRGQSNILFATGGNTERVSIASNGDISFYEDTGTTAKFFWDASAERLGIGTTSPSAPLHVGGEAYFDAGTRHYTYDDQANFWSLYTNTDDSFRFNYNGAGADEVVIDTSGNVGIGTTSPTSPLDVSGVITSKADGAVNDAQIGRLNFTNTNSNASSNPIRASILSGRQNSAWGGYLSLYTSTGTSAASEKVRIGETGNVGIGTSSISGRLEIKKATASNETMFAIEASGVTTTTVGSITYDQSDDSMRLLNNSDFGGTSLRLGTRGNDNVIIDYSGNVGIGTDSPSAKLTVAGGSDMGVRIISDAGGYASLQLGDANDFVRGGITYNSADDSLQLRGYNNAERLRIDSSGNVLVGKTAPTISTTGVELRPNGQVFATQSGNYPLLLNRTTSDGDIIQLRKDGTTVGSISSNGGSASYNSNSGVIFLGNNQTNHFKFLTSQATGQPRFEPSGDNTIDVGRAALRFKDLYLGGGVHLGGTGSANKLDDYEEGTWTPVLSNSGSPTYQVQSGWYTKIGNLVNFSCMIDVNAGISGSAAVIITGLPFSIRGEGNQNFPSFPTFIERGINGSSATQGYMTLGQAGAAAMEVWEQFNSTGINYNNLTYAEVTSNYFRIRITGTYLT